MRILPVLLLLVLLAGCISTSPASTVATKPEPTAADIGAPIEQNHDHTDPALHKHILNLERVAVLNGHDGQPAPNGEAYAETAVKNGYAYLTRYGPESGIAIFDVHDLEHPKMVGSVRLDEGFEPDVEISDDGNWAFWETQRFPVQPTVPDVLNPMSNAPHGVHIVDIKDKAHPKDVGFYPVTPDGPHSITYANIGGRNILFLSVYAFAYAYENVEVPNAQRLEITELDTSGPVPMLKKLAEYRQPGATGGPGLFPHDVTIQKHPITGDYLAYVAYWDVGMVILNVNDPAQPKLVSAFKDFGPAHYSQVHMARSFPTLIDGKHVTVVEPEHDGGGGADTGYMSFVDTTDPAHPSLISSWLLPGNLTAAGLRFSPHYFDVDNGRVTLASYHAGVWIIDVHDHAHLLDPTTVGYAELTSTRKAAVPNPIFGNEESAFDAWWAKDATNPGAYVIAGDSLEGLAIYRYTGPAPSVVTAAQ